VQSSKQEEKQKLSRRWKTWVQKISLTPSFSLVCDGLAAPWWFVYKHFLKLCQCEFRHSRNTKPKRDAWVSGGLVSVANVFFDGLTVDFVGVAALAFVAVFCPLTINS